MTTRSMRARTWRFAAIAGAAVLATASPAQAATGWTITPSSNPSTAVQTYLDGVSCVGVTTLGCFAVGSYVSSVGTVRTLTERWNGTRWAGVTSPNRYGAIATALVDVSCTSASNCFAVGNSQATPTSPAVTLIERWNGSSWKIVASPNAANATGSYLYAISCVGVRCFAVGNYTSANTAGSTLIESWNGTAWKVSPSPNHSGSAFNSLAGVSCNAVATGLTCFAVGTWSQTSDDSVPSTLTERWNGSSWVVIASPNVGGQYRSALTAVSCTSARSCMAVGYWQHMPGASLSEHWNGSVWTIVPVSNPTGWNFSQLNSVSCASSISCIGVGTWSKGTATGLTLVARWNGSAWAIPYSPNPSGSKSSSLNAVSCVGLKCSAAGSWLRPVGGSASLTEHNF